MQDSKSNILGGIYLIAPAIVMFALFHPDVGFRPAQALSQGDPMAAWAAALVGLVPGYLIYKRVVTVRGHEWHRLQALKKLSKHYRSEDSGSWEEDQSFRLRTTQGSTEVGELTQKALEKMQGKVGDLMMDNQEEGNEIETSTEIELLSERDHVRLAAARMRGDTSLEDKTSKTTVADRDQKTAMDKLLDWFALKLSMKKGKNIQKTDVVSPPEINYHESNIQNVSTGASEYDSLISNSWHCRNCSKMNSIDANYCETCGSSKL